MQAVNTPHLQPYHPVTFLERGVAVPFTTPMLAGTRARPRERGGTELIVPNPSGGSGAYVLPWNGVRDLCRPTMHDAQLNAMIAELAAITPSDIRAAARTIAAEGLAGRPARTAADAAAAQEQRDRLVTNFLLLLELVKQAEPPGSNRVPPEQEQPAILERRARSVITQIAPLLSLSPDRVANGLERLADLFCPIGIGKDARDARHVRLIDSLIGLRDRMTGWANSHHDDSVPAARMVANVADVTLSCAAAILASTRAMVDDLPALLRSLDAAPTTVIERATRMDWLLDGWEQICLVWQTAETAVTQRAALADMALMVPVLPREVVSWMDNTVLADDVGHLRRFVPINQDWRTGVTVFDLVARNEHIRALAA